MPQVALEALAGSKVAQAHGSLERATSAMEVLAVAGRNAALLVADAMAPSQTAADDAGGAKSEL